jgi:hypothetical protein
VSQTQSIQFANISATTGAFTLFGGQYALTCSATFGGGNVQLQTLSLDGVTWINVGAAISVASVTDFTLAAGTYRFVVTTATAVYVSLTKISL